MKLYAAALACVVIASAGCKSEGVAEREPSRSQEAASSDAASADPKSDPTSSTKTDTNGWLQKIVTQKLPDTQALGIAFGARIGSDFFVGAAGRKAPQGEVMGSNERFQAGSITKTMTAVLVMQAVEGGQLSLDGNLSRWFPSIPVASNTTIRQLLNHTSGFPDYLQSQSLSFSESITPAGIVEKSLELPLGNAGTHQYSNTNYVMLGIILENVTGQSYEQLLKTKIFGPAGMADSYLNNGGSSQNHLGGFNSQNGFARDPAEHGTVAWASGAVVTTLSDLSKFSQMLFGGKLVSQASLTQMLKGVAVPQAPNNLAYGLGISTEDTPWGKLYYHEGLINNTNAFLGFFPDLDMHLVGYANAHPANTFSVVEAVAAHVAK